MFLDRKNVSKNIVFSHILKMPCDNARSTRCLTSTSARGAKVWTLTRACHRFSQGSPQV